MTKNLMVFVTVAANVVVVAIAAALVGGVDGVQAAVIGGVAAGSNLLLNKYLVVR